MKRKSPDVALVEVPPVAIPESPAVSTVYVIAEPELLRSNMSVALLKNKERDMTRGLLKIFNLQNKEKFVRQSMIILIQRQSLEAQGVENDGD